MPNNGRGISLRMLLRQRRHRQRRKGRSSPALPRPAVRSLNRGCTTTTSGIMSPALEGMLRVIRLGCWVGRLLLSMRLQNPLRNIDMLGLVPACHSGCNHRWDTCLITCRSLFPTPLIRCTKDKRECNNESTTTQWYISTQRNWLLYTEMSCNEFDAWYRRYNPEPPSA